MPNHITHGRQSWFQMLFAPALYAFSFYGYALTLYLPVIFFLPSRTFTIPYRMLALLIPLYAIYCVMQKGYRMYNGKLLILLILFWGGYVLRIFIEHMSGEPLPKSITFYYQMVIGVASIPMIPFFLNHSKQALRSAFWSLALTAVVCVTVNFALYGVSIGGFAGRAKGGGMVDGVVALGPLLMAYLGSAIIVLGIFSAMAPSFFAPLGRPAGNNPELGIVERWILYLPSLLIPVSMRPLIFRFGVSVALLLGGAYLLVMGASRGPVLSIAACGFILMLSRRQLVDYIFRALGLLVLLGLLGSLTLYLSSLAGSGFAYRILGIFNAVEEIQYGNAEYGRYYIWLDAIDAIRANPLFGSGLFLESTSTYPHNAILECYMALGIVGGTLYVIILFSCVRVAWRILRKAPECGWVSLLFIHYAVYVQLSSSIIVNHYFWCSAAAVIGVDHMLRTQGQQR